MSDADALLCVASFCVTFAIVFPLAFWGATIIADRYFFNTKDKKP